MLKKILAIWFWVGFIFLTLSPSQAAYECLFYQPDGLATADQAKPLLLLLENQLKQAYQITVRCRYSADQKFFESQLKKKKIDLLFTRFDVPFFYKKLWPKNNQALAIVQLGQKSNLGFYTLLAYQKVKETHTIWSYQNLKPEVLEYLWPDLFLDFGSKLKKTDSLFSKLRQNSQDAFLVDHLQYLSLAQMELAKKWPIQIRSQPVNSAWLLFVSDKAKKDLPKLKKTFLNLHTQPKIKEILDELKIKHFVAFDQLDKKYQSWFLSQIKNEKK